MKGYVLDKEVGGYDNVLSFVYTRVNTNWWSRLYMPRMQFEMAYITTRLK